MNGRMYDAKLGRFLSPDNFVTSVFDTQSYNRYSYVLNNPLMYSDPSGEFIWFAVIAGAIINASVKAMQGGSFGQVLLAGVIGAATGIIAGGVGNLVAGGAFFSNAAMGVTGFIAGAGVGGVSGMAAGFAGGIMNTFANGGNFSDALGAGIKGAISGALIGAVVGGVSGGIRARKMGVDFWEADRITDEVKFNSLFKNDTNAVACNNCDDMVSGDGLDYDSMFHNGESISDFRANLSGSDGDAWNQTLKAYRKVAFGSATGKHYKYGELFNFKSIPKSGNGWSYSRGYYHAKTYWAGTPGETYATYADGYSANFKVSQLSNQGVTGFGVPNIYMRTAGFELNTMLHFKGSNGYYLNIATLLGFTNL